MHQLVLCFSILPETSLHYTTLLCKPHFTPQQSTTQANTKLPYYTTPHRRSESVLTSQLPTKVEYTLLVRMSPIQRLLYKTFMDLIENGQNQWIGTNPLKAFAVCCKVSWLIHCFSSILITSEFTRSILP